MARQRTTARPQKRRRVSLREDLVRGAGPLPAGQARVDREARVIRGVKVLGLESANGRRYLPEALRKAIPLYEGVVVYKNHPKRPDDPREVEETLGWLKDVREGKDGCLYADLHYLESDGFTEKLCEIAESNHELIGFSHNAQGEGETVNGIFIVQEIVEVRSCDLVADPATTGGLFEQRGKRMKLGAYLLECLKVAKAGKAARKVLTRLTEDDLTSPDMDMDAPAGGAAPEEDHEQALADGFRAACNAVLDDDTLSADEKVKKIKEYLKAHEKLKGPGKDTEEEDDSGAEDTEEEDDGGEDVEEECDDKKDKMKESKELKRLKAKDRARDLCEAAGVVPPAPLLAALTALADDKTRKALIEQFKGAGDPRRRPRSGSTGTGDGGKAAVDTLEGFMTAARG